MGRGRGRCVEAKPGTFPSHEDNYIEKYIRVCITALCYSTGILARVTSADETKTETESNTTTCLVVLISSEEPPSSAKNT